MVFKPILIKEAFYDDKLNTYYIKNCLEENKSRQFDQSNYFSDLNRSNGILFMYKKITII